MRNSIGEAAAQTQICGLDSGPTEGIKKYQIICYWSVDSKANEPTSTVIALSRYLPWF
jgi:hypothetical protein